MEMTVKLQVFEGPLDLLLYLLEKNKVNIYDIPIVEITDQYMEYIDEMRQRDLEVMSEFLVMAATLLSIKAKMLLPKKKNEEEEEVDPREELVQQLLEYKMYKYMAYELKDRQIDAEKSMYKKPTIPKEVKCYEEPINLDELVKGITLQKLNKIFKDVMKKQVDKVDPIRSKFGKIEKEEFSLEEKMLYVENYALNRANFSFRNLLEEQSSKTEIIVTFLAILELMKSGKIYISQEEKFGDINIESKIYTKEKNNFDVDIISPESKKYNRDIYEVDINNSLDKTTTNINVQRNDNQKSINTNNREDL
ncbi:condensin subunit ScpA [Lachnobacterium bovis]|uniref:Segregation and condensation protein A n=1 Tax=Lachnobacterium bovis TaxID=140626 RepID=A0A1H9QM49_9FIRM|nr:segregation/condensation protein A [Lachnobacterium bovis]SER60919.1 condensin subunit ScpA [Lachnobacterium bovis]